jgi:hypothetical protein
MKKFRLLIVDDEPLIRAGIRDSLSGREDVEVAVLVSNREVERLVVVTHVEIRLSAVIAVADVVPHDGVAGKGRRGQHSEVRLLSLLTGDILSGSFSSEARGGF